MYEFENEGDMGKMSQIDKITLPSSKERGQNIHLIFPLLNIMFMVQLLSLEFLNLKTN